MATTAVALDPIALAAREGLSAPQRSLSPWLFYDEAGSKLFEQITTLPEYYLTRTERALLELHANDILSTPLTIAELGAGTATKTGILLKAAVKLQREVLYQPIDVSPTALDEARQSLERDLPGVRVRPQVANYITEPISIERPLLAGKPTRILALYIGSSIGNFTPEEAQGILRNLRQRLQPGDSLLLGTDLAPSPAKSVEQLIAAYDDAQGVTAAFNKNILMRLNRDLGADFNPDRFRHEARWNAAQSRIEMHLVSDAQQTVVIPANATGAAQHLRFAANQSIHTENSYKFTRRGVATLLAATGFTAARTFEDKNHLFAVTLASAV